MSSCIGAVEGDNAFGQFWEQFNTDQLYITFNCEFGSLQFTVFNLQATGVAPVSRCTAVVVARWRQLKKTNEQKDKIYLAGPHCWV